jgi:hypothetical protein
MTAPSAQTLQRLASETSLQPGTLEKVMRLLDVLQEIAGDELLADRLVLKGGTALNVFHLGLARLSVDIDLNYVGALDRATMETERPVIDAALNRLLTAMGYAIRRQPDEHAGGKWIGRSPRPWAAAPPWRWTSITWRDNRCSALIGSIPSRSRTCRRGASRC